MVADVLMCPIRFLLKAKLVEMGTRQYRLGSGPVDNRHVRTMPVVGAGVLLPNAGERIIVDWRSRTRISEGDILPRIATYLQAQAGECWTNPIVAYQPSGLAEDGTCSECRDPISMVQGSRLAIEQH